MLNLAEVPANIKKKFCDLPAFRQTKKNKKELCRWFGKRRKNKKCLADSLANAKIIFCDLPTFRQTRNRNFELFRRFGKPKRNRSRTLCTGLTALSDASSSPVS
ncbi:hypothetical protein [Segatella oulorum]|uniref:hypothetical protein n=1 Tax=Segatella oulorum TaxID=28136 RepID=UPI0023F528C3|nr:hypothetical protein [Segatella oulorum]